MAPDDSLSGVITLNVNISIPKNKNGAKCWLAPFARRISDGPEHQAAETGGNLPRLRGTTDTGCNWNELSPAGIIDNGTVRFAVPCRFFDSSQAHNLGS